MSVQFSLANDRLRDYSGTFQVQVATSLADLLEQIEQTKFSAILLDLPDHESLQTLLKLQDLEMSIPLIVLSEDGCDDLALAALRAGADDCLSRNRISSETLPRALRSAIERRQRISVELKLHAAQAEVLAAETIHRRLLPQHSPRISGVELAGICLPAESVGGDLFDYLYCDEDRCLGVVADVSGHGLPAAILMTELHGLLHGLVDQNLDLVHIAESANRRVLDASQNHQFITMLLFQLDMRTQEFSYVSAGHPGWMVKKSGVEEILHERQLPLGVEVDRHPFQLSRISIHSGDVLVLPTDGVFETLSDQGEMFGVDRMLKVVREHSHLSADEIMRVVVNEVGHFSSSAQLADDLTLLVIKVD